MVPSSFYLLLHIPQVSWVIRKTLQRTYLLGNYQSSELQGSERTAKVAREANDSHNVVKSIGGVRASHSLLPCLLDVGAANN